MADVGSPDVLDEIQALVSDMLQVISYKWLSRSFLVSSNDAKRILQKFVEKHGSGLEVIYSLSGWLKDNPSTYHIRLVSGRNLAEVKQEFEENCSVQVYSVQACIPKDSAELWSAEFVQAEELFNQPPSIDNCLRDNRFCGVSNSFVKRNANGTPVGVAIPQPKNAGVLEPSKSHSAHQTPVPQPQQRIVKEASPKVGLQSTTGVTTNVKSDSNGTEVHAQASKPCTDKKNIAAFPANKRKGQTEKSSSETGGSLANLWGRASAKSKPSSPPAETNNIVQTPTVSQEAQTPACVETVSSDDSEHYVNYKRASNGEGSRKRRVVFDFSDDDDDYENAVSLASPDPPRQSSLDSKHNTKISVHEKTNLNLKRQKENKPKIKQEKATYRESGPLLREEPAVSSKGKTTGISITEKIQSCVHENDVNKKDKMTDAVLSTPKRRKVLKTRIDERGREVTEVVWEGEETESKKAENSTISDTVNKRPPAAKSPALGSTGPSNPASKAGNKKTGGHAKDANQGNILSFFKRA